MNVLEIWQYEMIQYNRDTDVRGLFTDDINTFVKIKQEVSGWPKQCENNPIEQKLYLENYEKAEAIKLEKEKITHNPGLRSVAKLFLNSLWGKLGQHENLTQTEIVNNRVKLMELLTNPEIDITGLH